MTQCARVASNAPARHAHQAAIFYSQTVGNW